MIYYIADLHFGHENIIRLCSRPFADAEEMDRTLIDNWNSVVTDKDEVYVVGDFCFTTKKKAVDYLVQLKGKKHLIIGNHDKGIMKDPDAVKCFESIGHMKTIRDSGRKIFLCHYPVAEWPGYYHGMIHFYGHIHNAENTTKEIMDGIPNAYNVGADLLGFTPRTADYIIGE